ncbi:MAG: helix-turn-helix domain-containing protein [Bacteroidota bacterium]
MDSATLTHYFLKIREESELPLEKLTIYLTEGLATAQKLELKRVIFQFNEELRYIQELRYWEARRMLEIGEYQSVKAVCLLVGLKDIRNFSKKFKERFGLYPSECLRPLV